MKKYGLLIDASELYGLSFLPIVCQVTEPGTSKSRKHQIPRFKTSFSQYEPGNRLQQYPRFSLMKALSLR